MKRIGILGSTGSIGRSTLSVVRDFPERFQAVSLTAGENVSLMVDQVLETKPLFVSMATVDAANELRTRLRERGCNPLPEISYGQHGMKLAATLPEVNV